MGVGFEVVHNQLRHDRNQWNQGALTDSNGVQSNGDQSISMFRYVSVPISYVSHISVHFSTNWFNFVRLGSKIDFLRSFPDDSAWFCVEESKNIVFPKKHYS